MSRESLLESQETASWYGSTERLDPGVFNSWSTSVDWKLVFAHSLSVFDSKPGKLMIVAKSICFSAMWLLLLVFSSDNSQIVLSGLVMLVINASMIMTSVYASCIIVHLVFCSTAMLSLAIGSCILVYAEDLDIHTHPLLMLVISETVISANVTAVGIVFLGHFLCLIHQQLNRPKRCSQWFLVTSKAPLDLCCICLDRFDRLTWQSKNCKHCFHALCIQTWMQSQHQRHMECPMCKTHFNPLQSHDA